MLVKAFKSAVLAALLVVAPLSAPALARTFDDGEKQALADAVKAFDDAMAGGDYTKVVATIPPKVLQAMADKYGVPVDQLRTLVIQQTEQAMKTVTLVSYSMDVPNADYQETADGTPYALVPTETVIDMGGSKMKATAATLAINDEGQWYLVRVSEKAQVDIFKSVYPSFADVVFPEGKMEPVQ